MSSGARLSLYAVVAIGLVAMITLWLGQSAATQSDQEKWSTGESVVRYATDEFVAACRVRPKNLVDHAFFGSLPIDKLMPTPLSLARLDAMDIEELVVFCAPDGAPKEKGINVGRMYEYRGFVEGGTKSSAIFTLDHIDAADLVDDHLPLDFRPDVFRTYFTDRDHSAAQIELRNPDSKLCSEPISFEAKSYVNHRLRIPRTINVRGGK
jgi:hypothetical protein